MDTGTVQAESIIRGRLTGGYPPAEDCFSDRDVLRVALEFEQGSIDFYEGLQAKNFPHEVRFVCCLFAEAERDHKKAVLDAIDSAIIESELRLISRGRLTGLRSMASSVFRVLQASTIDEPGLMRTLDAVMEFEINSQAFFADVRTIVCDRDTFLVNRIIEQRAGHFRKIYELKLSYLNPGLNWQGH